MMPLSVFEAELTEGSSFALLKDGWRFNFRDGKEPRFIELIEVYIKSTKRV